jgi:hypothetical protein
LPFLQPVKSAGREKIDQPRGSRIIVGRKEKVAGRRMIFIEVGPEDLIFTTLASKSRGRQPFSLTRVCFHTFSCMKAPY